MIVDMMCLLSKAGIGSILPDLPGTNESVFPQDKANLDIWKDAMTACLAKHVSSGMIVSFRGGCLIDNIAEAKSNWRMSPAKGKSLLRSMMRARIASDKEAGIVTKMTDLNTIAASSPIELAGNILGSEMVTQLQDVILETSTKMRTARLESDSQSADVKLSGSPLWLRAEPDADLELSKSIADDLIAWARP